MRVSIERGYHHHVKAVMDQLKTDDPKLAIHHIIGCWVASQGCSGIGTQSRTAAPTSPKVIDETDFDLLTDWGS